MLSILRWVSIWYIIDNEKICFHHFLFLLLQSFFASVLADGLSLEFAWQQVSSSFQESSQYSDRSHHFCSLDSLHPSRYFQVLQSLYQSFGDCTKNTNFYWNNHHFHVPQFFPFPSKAQVLNRLFAFLQLYSMVSEDHKVHNSANFFFFSLFFITKFGRLAEVKWSVCISKS